MVSQAARAAAEQRAAAATNQGADAWKKASAHLPIVAKIATRKIEDMEANTRLFTKEQLDVIPTFNVDELSLGRVLGKGGFGTVKEIRTIKCTFDSAGPEASDEEGGDIKKQMLHDKKFIADHCLRESGEARYCVKVREASLYLPIVAFFLGDSN